MKKAEDGFEWHVQKAGYDFDRYDSRGKTDYTKFITAFEQFPWMDQLDYFQNNEEGCSPTLSVQDLKTKTAFWVSMAGDRNVHGYLIGYIYPKEKRGFLGLGSVKTIRWVEIYLTQDDRLVKECFKLFFDRNHGELEVKIRALEAYGQMEARN